MTLHILLQHLNCELSVQGCCLLCRATDENYGQEQQHPALLWYLLFPCPQGRYSSGAVAFVLIILEDLLSSSSVGGEGALMRLHGLLATRTDL